MKRCSGCNRRLDIDDFVKCGKKYRIKTDDYRQDHRPVCKPCWSKAEMKRVRAKK